jgi:uncharacterized protein YbjT (DUF2867 family)
LVTLEQIFRDSGVPCSVIQDVTFLGGAAQLDKKRDKYNQIVASVVNGSIKNVYSEADIILRI